MNKRTTSENVVFFVVVNFAVQVKFYLALVLQFRLFLLFVLQQVRVYSVIFLKLPFVDIIIIYIYWIFGYLLPQFLVVFYHFLLVLLHQKTHEQSPQALSHREDNWPGEYFQHMSVFYLIHITIEKVMICEEVFNVGECIQPAVMGVSLAGKQNLISFHIWKFCRNWFSFQ